jgi:hypothetical protein
MAHRSDTTKLDRRIHPRNRNDREARYPGHGVMTGAGRAIESLTLSC